MSIAMVQRRKLRLRNRSKIISRATKMESKTESAAIFGMLRVSQALGWSLTVLSLVSFHSTQGTDFATSVLQMGKPESREEKVTRPGHKVRKLQKLGMNPGCPGSRSSRYARPVVTNPQHAQFAPNPCLASHSAPFPRLPRRNRDYLLSNMPHSELPPQRQPQRRPELHLLLIEGSRQLQANTPLCAGSSCSFHILHYYTQTSGSCPPEGSKILFNPGDGLCALKASRCNLPALLPPRPPGFASPARRFLLHAARPLSSVVNSTRKVHETGAGA